MQNAQRGAFIKSNLAGYDDQRQQWEQERAEREQYRQLVAYAREALHDDYYVANHFCPGIILEFSDICKQGDEAILAKAREKELI